MKRLIFLLLVISSPLMGQITPPSVNTDSTRNDDEIIVSSEKEVNIEDIETYADKFVPRKASLYSAIFPGGGQIYNKKYWKLPLVYGGLVALGATANFYHRRYDLYRGQLFDFLQDGTKPPSGATEAQLRSAIDDARRDRDYYMILTGVFYLLQILDAHIDAHLKEFDLNPDLKVSVDPLLERNQFARKQFNTGISLKFTF